MTQADREREKGARQHAGGGALFGLNKGRHADIQIPHTHTSQQEDKERNRTGKLKMKELEAACGIRKILKKGVTIVRTPQGPQRSLQITVIGADSDRNAAATVPIMQRVRLQ